MKLGALFYALLIIGATPYAMTQPITPEEFAKASQKARTEYARHDDLYNDIRVALGAPDVLHPDLSKTRFGAQIQSAIGDESGFLFSINFEDEASLVEASEAGLLDDLSQICFQKLLERFEMNDDAVVKIRFNSFEYIRAAGDGFNRIRDGDRRTDFEIVLNRSGEKISNAPNN